MLKWARRNGCPWDSYTFTSAILSHRPDMLRWVRAEGCPEVSRLMLG